MNYNDIMNAGYGLTDDELELCSNKTLGEINLESSKLLKTECLVRQMIRDYLSRHLANTSEEMPLITDICIDTKEAFGLSSLELPRLTKMWQCPGEGWITFVVNGAIVDFDNMYTDDLIYIINHLE